MRWDNKKKGTTPIGAVPWTIPKTMENFHLIWFGFVYHSRHSFMQQFWTFVLFGMIFVSFATACYSCFSYLGQETFCIHTPYIPIHPLVGGKSIIWQRKVNNSSQYTPIAMPYYAPPMLCYACIKNNAAAAVKTVSLCSVPVKLVCLHVVCVSECEWEWAS